VVSARGRIFVPILLFATEAVARGREIVVPKIKMPPGAEPANVTLDVVGRRLTNHGRRQRTRESLPVLVDPKPAGGQVLLPPGERVVVFSFEFLARDHHFS